MHEFVISVFALAMFDCIGTKKKDKRRNVAGFSYYQNAEVWKNSIERVWDYM